MTISKKDLIKNMIFSGIGLLSISGFSAHSMQKAASTVGIHDSNTALSALKKQLNDLIGDPNYPKRMQLVKMFLQDHPAINPDEIKHYHQTMLEEATVHNNIENMQFFLARGANPDQIGSLFQEPLLYRARTREAAQIILNAGADIGPVPRIYIYDLRNVQDAAAQRQHTIREALNEHMANDCSSIVIAYYEKEQYKAAQPKLKNPKSTELNIGKYIGIAIIGTATATLLYRTFKQ